MPRGVPSAITTELDKDVIKDGFFYLFDLELRSGTRYWDKRGITYTAHTYEPRILSVSDIGFTSGDTNEVTLTVSNLDGALTTIDQSESVYGCKVTIRQYVPAVGDAYIVWVGWLEEITEIGVDTATLTVYSNTPSQYSPVPRRVIGLTCPSEFANNSNWVSTTQFDGSECRYPATGTQWTANPQIGFVGALVGDVTSGATSFDVLLNSVQAGAGMLYKVSDQIGIESEIMLVTAVTAVSGAWKQTLTVTRG